MDLEAASIRKVGIGVQEGNELAETRPGAVGQVAVGPEQQHAGNVGYRGLLLETLEHGHRNSQKCAQARQLAIVRAALRGLPVADHRSAHTERVGQIVLAQPAAFPGADQLVGKRHQAPPTVGDWA